LLTCPTTRGDHSSVRAEHAISSETGAFCSSNLIFEGIIAN